MAQLSAVILTKDFLGSESAAAHCCYGSLEDGSIHVEAGALVDHVADLSFGVVRVGRLEDGKLSSTCRVGDNLHLVTEDITGCTIKTTLNVDGLDDGGKILLADLVRAEVPVLLGAGRVGVVGIEGGIGVTLGWIGATLPGNPDIVADIEKTGGQRANRGGRGVHPVLAGAELSVPQEHRAEIVRQHLAIIVTDDARYSKFVAIGGGDLVGLPQPVEALVEHQQGEGIKLFAVGLRGLHGLLDTIDSGA